jgi:hypothetical protein
VNHSGFSVQDSGLAASAVDCALSRKFSSRLPSVEARM